MRHLKLFENGFVDKQKEKLYKIIYSRQSIEYLEINSISDNFSKRAFSIIKESNKFYRFNINYSSKEVRINLSSLQYLIFIELKDEYFFIRDVRQTVNYYLCDGIDGLEEWLGDKLSLKGHDAYDTYKCILEGQYNLIFKNIDNFVNISRSASILIKKIINSSNPGPTIPNKDHFYEGLRVIKFDSQLDFHQLKDGWFLIKFEFNKLGSTKSYNNPFDYTYYLCDQMEGLEQCLNYWYDSFSKVGFY